jgi:predicted PurR-regulated permease PerM
LTILFLLGKIDYLIDFLYLIISSVFFPLFIAGLLYYLLRPCIRYLVKKKVPKYAAILLILFVLILTVSGISTVAFPVIADQLINLTEDFPKKIGEATEKTGKMVIGENPSLIDSTQVSKLATERLKKFTSSVSKDLIELAATLTNIALVLLVVPFILFYLLLDDKKFFNYFLRLVPSHMEHDVAAILRDIDSTLSSYIKGQVLVAFFVGTFMYAGYLLIGLKFALVLALFAVLTNVIPFLGPFIGVFPAFSRIDSRTVFGNKSGFCYSCCTAGGRKYPISPNHGETASHPSSDNYFSGTDGWCSVRFYRFAVSDSSLCGYKDTHQQPLPDLLII